MSMFFFLAIDYHFVYDSVTMQAQREMPPDMQCKDKFLLQSAVASPGATTKDITSEMVIIKHRTMLPFILVLKD